MVDENVKTVTATTLLDNLGNALAPRTKSSLVTNAENKSIDTLLKELEAKAEMGAQTKADVAGEKAKDASVPLASKGVAGGVAGLDADGKISAENLPPMDFATSGEFLNHATDGEIHVTPILIGNFNTAIAGLMEHADDEVIHTTAGDKANWTQGAVTASKAAADAALALNHAAALESRVARVEDGLFNNIMGNPFLASFDTITGIAISKGVWNKARRRIEC